MEQRDDPRVKGWTPLTVSKIMKNDIPISEKGAETVSRTRATIKKILSREDKRLLVVLGPFSIHV
jgi:3-deoxy-7-phosphoheptulonate synthase